MNIIEEIFNFFRNHIIFVIFLLFIIIILFRARHTIKLNRKFKKYTVSSINENKEFSLFDYINFYFNKLVKINSYIISKIKVFNKYSTKYEKHIIFEDLDKKNGIDFISKKFLIAYFTLLLYIISLLFQNSKITFIGAFISFIIGFFVLDILIQISYKRKKKIIEEDLLKAIIIMNNAFKSGRSTIQAIEIVKNELSGPISDEFKKIYKDLTYGLSIETVFDRFYKRVEIEDAKYLTSSLTLLNKTGGNIVKVFTSIEKDFMNKKKLMNELKTMTASNVFVFRILLGIPFILFIVIFMLNNEFFNPLFKNSIGIFIVILIILLYSLYIIVVKNVLRIDI